MENLADLKLHVTELEEENKRLVHQQKRLDEEIKIIEDAIREQMNRQKPEEGEPPTLRLELIETNCNDVPTNL